MSWNSFRTNLSEEIDHFGEISVGLILLAMPAQAALEVYHWWHEATWVNYDLRTVFPKETQTVIQSIDAKGAQSIVAWFSDIWVSLFSIPVSLIAMLGLNMLALIIRPNFDDNSGV